MRRSMLENNSIQAAQYEMCAHKWVDMSENDFGVALINDSKYGYRCKDGCISVDLLRSEMYPCSNQDKGTHSFSYALYGHNGNIYQSDVAACAYAFVIISLYFACASGVIWGYCAYAALAVPSKPASMNPHATVFFIVIILSIRYCFSCFV